MTQEQKQKLAERIAEKAMSAKNVTYAVVLQAVHEALNARDEEVERLENENAELSEQLKMNAENIQKLCAELAKAQNPWRDVLTDNELPSSGDLVFAVREKYGENSAFLAYYIRDSKDGYVFRNETGEFLVKHGTLYAWKKESNSFYTKKPVPTTKCERR